MADSGQLSFNLLGDFTLKVQLRGSWRLRVGLPSAALVEHELESARQVRDIAFDTRELTSWDSSVLTFLVEVSELCRQRSIPMNREGLPVGVQKLLALAEAVPERKGARREATEASLLERVGTSALGLAGSGKEMLAFLGEMTITFVRLFGMKARYRASDLFLLIQQCGAQAGSEQISLGIGPVKLPGYLDRQELVTRISQNRFDVSENDRWAEPLENNFTRTLSQNLSALLQTDRVIAFPWQTSQRPKYQVEIEVLRFEPNAAREALLVARWTVIDVDSRKLLSVKESRLTRQAREKSTEAAVAALSEVLGAFSREVADAIRAIGGGKGS
jgi:uncharacterized lipoprotein YmbA/ABC-type transporter Mla MlaB component